MPIINRINGTDGKVTIPSIGALIGYFSQWSLSSENGKTYLFKAVFAHLNPTLWDEPSMTKLMVVQWSKGKFYRLEQEPSAERTLTGRQLIMKEVTLWPHEGSQQ